MGVETTAGIMGFETQHISVIDNGTGHANILCADDGENAIVLFSGANHNHHPDEVPLCRGVTGDFFCLIAQNETLATPPFAARTCASYRLGLRVAYAFPHPFDAGDVRPAAAIRRHIWISHALCLTHEVERARPAAHSRRTRVCHLATSRRPRPIATLTIS